MLKLAALTLIAITFSLLLLLPQPNPSLSASAAPGGASTSTLTSTPLSTPTSTSSPAPTSIPSPTCELGWKSVPSPAHNDLTSIEFVSPDDGWTVGNDGIFRWNGSTWNAVPFPTPKSADTPPWFTSISAWSATDIWSSASYSNGANILSVVYHWDGSQWSIIPNDLPLPAGQSSQNLTAIVATAPHQAIAVGWESFGTYITSIILTCSTDDCVHSTPLVNVGLNAVDALSPGDVWAVGNYRESGYPYALHYDGTSWQSVPISNTYYPLEDVTAISANDIWVIGHDGARHWDGTSWTRFDSSTLFKSLFAVSSNDIWAVGAAFEPAPNIWHWDGTQWSSIFPFTLALFGVAAAAPGDIWAVGSNGMILRYQPHQTYQDVPTTSTFDLSIAKLTCLSIANGYPCGGPSEPCIPPSDLPYFRPSNNITRGQLSKIISLSANFTPITNTQTFEDVPIGSTFHPYIESLYAHNAINGYPCGGPSEPCVAPTNRPYFRPAIFSTRGQAAKVVAIASGHTDLIEQQTFQDVGLDSPYWVYVENLAALNVISGYGCGSAGEPCIPPSFRPYFRPSNNLSRGQLSKISVKTFFP